MRFNARRLQAGAQVVGCARLRAVARQTMALGAWGHRAFIRSSLAQRGASDTVGRMFAPRCACGAYGGCCDESGFGQQLLEAGVIASRSRLGVSWFQRSRNFGAHCAHMLRNRIWFGRGATHEPPLAKCPGMCFRICASTYLSQIPEVAFEPNLFLLSTLGRCAAYLGADAGIANHASAPEVLKL